MDQRTRQTDGSYRVSFQEFQAGRPDLVREFSYELKPGWWLGTNLSRHSIERVLEIACEVAGVKYGTELKVNVGSSENLPERAR
jgi:hypothetical protein